MTFLYHDPPGVTAVPNLPRHRDTGTQGSCLSEAEEARSATAVCSQASDTMNLPLTQQ